MNFKTIIGIVAAIGLFSTSSSYAFRFKPTVSLIGSYTFTQNYSHLNAGAFEIDNRNLNYGLEITHKFRLVDEFFFKTGLRYHRYKKIITGHNPVPELHFDTDLFSWTRRYEAIQVPLLVGKNFVTSKGYKGDVYLGFSLGTLLTSYADNVPATSFTRAPGFDDLVAIGIYNTSLDKPPFFFPTFEMGVNYSPIKKRPEFSVGLLCSVQLKKAQYSEHHALIEVSSRDHDFFYDLYTENRVFNASLLLSYTFRGKTVK